MRFLPISRFLFFRGFLWRLYRPESHALQIFFPQPVMKNHFKLLYKTRS